MAGEIRKHFSPDVSSNLTRSFARCLCTRLNQMGPTPGSRRGVEDPKATNLRVVA